jgi:hypothetical protein
MVMPLFAKSRVLLLNSLKKAICVKTLFFIMKIDGILKNSVSIQRAIFNYDNYRMNRNYVISSGFEGAENFPFKKGGLRGFIKKIFS